MTDPKLPLPEASEPESETQAEAQPTRLEPTRYGDWEFKGKCVDF